MIHDQFEPVRVECMMARQTDAIEFGMLVAA